MAEPVYRYDEPSDSLQIAFAPGRAATGIELNEHVLLRIDLEERQLVGITLFDVSILSQLTDVGPRSFPLSGLDALPADLREMVLDILLRPGAREILSLTAYSPGTGESVPIVSLQPGIIARHAA